VVKSVYYMVIPVVKIYYRTWSVLNHMVCKIRIFDLQDHVLLVFATGEWIQNFQELISI
jgi:hypothetical protein